MLCNYFLRKETFLEWFIAYCLIYTILREVFLTRRQISGIKSCKRNYFLFTKRMVTNVSIVRNTANVTKKFIFSAAMFFSPPFNIGWISAYAINSLRQVNNIKALPTLFIFFCLIIINMKIMTIEQAEKKPYNCTRVYRYSTLW